MANPKKTAATGKISYGELFAEILVVLTQETGRQGITKDEQLHATPRLGLITAAKNQKVAQKLNNRPKLKAVGLVVTTQDVGSSDTVGELLGVCWGKLASANKK